MINEKILKKAIEKAVAGGYYLKGSVFSVESLQKVFIEQGLDSKVAFEKAFKKTVEERTNINNLFSPDFAKCFWGEETIAICQNCQRVRENRYDNKCCGSSITDYSWKESWQYYQHRMLDELQAGRDVLKYLQGFL